MTDAMLKVDKGIPLPQRKRGAGKPYRKLTGGKYPWLKLQLGDSFLVADRDIGSLTSQANVAGHRYDRKFETRKVDGGVRVWRTA